MRQNFLTKSRREKAKNRATIVTLTPNFHLPLDTYFGRVRTSVLVDAGPRRLEVTTPYPELLSK